MKRDTVVIMAAGKRRDRLSKDLQKAGCGNYALSPEESVKKCKRLGTKVKSIILYAEAGLIEKIQPLCPKAVFFVYADSPGYNKSVEGAGIVTLPAQCFNSCVIDQIRDTANFVKELEKMA